MSLWLDKVSSTLGTLESCLRRVGDGERVLDLVGLRDLRLVLNILPVKPSSNPESYKNHDISSEYCDKCDDVFVFYVI